MITCCDTSIHVRGDVSLQGTFVVATNFDLALPEELQAKGLQEFRKHKGCKRADCTTPAPVTGVDVIGTTRGRRGGRRGRQRQSRRTTTPEYYY